ncbi:MAG: hypothetical protein JWM35_1002 [Verrucomicrobia bacterium]|nr:hypothetical protein [Verrucomicrobiota bacterium]
MKLNGFVRFLLGVVFGFTFIVPLIALFHFQHWVAPATTLSYAYTHMITRCLSPGFVVACLVIAFALGFLIRRAPGVALGMMLPLPIATDIELREDPTSHNLIPFEILATWVPAFLVLMFVAWLGTKLRNLVSGRGDPKPKANAPAPSQ